MMDLKIAYADGSDFPSSAALHDLVRIYKFFFNRPMDEVKVQVVGVGKDSDFQLVLLCVFACRPSTAWR